MRHLSRKVLKRMGLVWDLGLGWVIQGGFKELGFALDWILAGSGNNSLIGHLNKFYPKGEKIRLS